MKTCSKCKREKENTEFYKDTSRKDGLGHSCKPCDSLRKKQHWLYNLDRYKENSKKYYLEHKEECNKKSKVYYEAHKKYLNCLQKEYVAKNYEKTKQYRKEYHSLNAERLCAKTKKWREDNHERFIEQGKIHYIENRKACLEATNQYKKQNPEKVAAWNNKRHAAKLNRTPPWLSKDDFRFIELFYKESDRLTKETGVRYNVDHIVPLQGKNVSGLHVPWNLQVITEEENFKKHNNF